MNTTNDNPERLSPAAGSPSNLDGYHAAMIIIKRLLDEAERDIPKTQRYVKPRSASFRAGYYRALLTAHCMSALGEFPLANVDTIKGALEMENASHQ
jgi:hypothetical protein